MTEKRKRIQDKILEVVGLLDNKRGTNLENYKNLFESMSDEEFGDFCNWCNDPSDLDQLDHTIFIQAMPLEEPSLQNIQAALKAINVPDEEYVTFDINGSGERIRSRYKIPVGYAPIRRMEQLLSKKNRYTLDNEQRSIKTDQVTGDSKVAALSPDESTSLLSHGADAIMKELYGARSGDSKARNQMYRDIALNGYVSLADIDSEDTENKETLNMLDTYLISAGLRTDLRIDSLKLPYTIKKELGKK